MTAGALTAIDPIAGVVTATFDVDESTGALLVRKLLRVLGS